MQVGSEKQIICEPDGSIAIINHLPSKTIFGDKITLDDLIAILAAHEIRAHIDTMALEIAIDKSLKTGAPIENIVAARSRIETEVIIEETERLNYIAFLKEVDNARKAYGYLVNLSSDNEVDYTVRYVQEGQTILQIFEANDEDIYGRKTKKRKLPVILKKGEGVSEYKAIGIQSFTADRNGYLVVDDNMRINIVSPFSVSPNKMKVHFTIMPLAHPNATRTILSDLTREYPTRVIGNQATCDLYSVIERVQLLFNAGDITEHIILAEGKPSKAGVDEVVKICVGTERDSYDGDAGLMDYAKTAQYCMVSKGEVLAEIIKAIPGETGLDVCGNELIPPDTKNKPLNIGQNIKKEESSDRIRLVAEKDGCFVCNNSQVSVTETLVINGDVGPRTGNISQGSSVIVSGNISSGFSVECKEDLVVNGSIENGAMVRCGRLIVKKGVFTKKGLVQVKSDADIGYIQDAVLRINGDLSVQRYIHNARLTVRGDLKVFGRGVSGRERGAVMGGKISVFGSAVIHSLGNENEDTMLLCGVDQDMHEQIAKGQAVVSALQTDIAMLQNQIGIDLAASNAAETLARLPRHQKEMIAEKLKLIKSHLVDIEDYTQKIQELTKRAYAEDMTKVSIAVSSHIIPRTTLAIGKDVLAITSRFAGGTARLLKGKINYCS